MGGIIIIFATVRAVEITYTARADAVLLALWGVLEASVCQSAQITALSSDANLVYVQR